MFIAATSTLFHAILTISKTHHPLPRQFDSGLIEGIKKGQFNRTVSAHCGGIAHAYCTRCRFAPAEIRRLQIIGGEEADHIPVRNLQGVAPGIGP